MGLKDWWDLTRFEHGIMWGLCVLIGEFLAMEGIPPLRLLAIGMLVPMLVEMGTFALNDYADMEKDIINKRTDRPLVRGTIKKEHALIVAIVTLFASLLLGLMLVSIVKAFIILVVFLALGILYDLKLKKYSALKNLTLALCVAVPFIGGNMIIRDDLVPMVLFITVVAFTVGYGREVMKDLMDVEGDRATGVKTFPILFGNRASVIIVVFLYSLTVILTLPPFFLNLSHIYYMNPAYGVIILITDVMILYTCYLLLFGFSVETVKKCRKITWIAMMIAIAGFLLPLLLYFRGG